MRRLVSLLICALASGIQVPATCAQAGPSYDLAQSERVGTTRYIVRPGDTIYSIARAVGVPVAAILDLNPGLDPRYLEVGDALRVPGHFVPIPRQRLTFAPPTGPADMLVELRGDGFLPNTRLRLLVGRSPYDFRRYSTVETNRRGRVLASVELPEWARPGRRVYFALQGFNGTNRTVAGPFRVVDAPPTGRLTVTGTIVRGGAECPLLRSDDGRRFSLAGDTNGFDIGDRVEVTGRLAGVSICMREPTLQVRRISEAD